MVTTHPEYSNNELFLIMLKNTFSVLTPKGPDVETLAVIHIEKATQVNIIHQFLNLG